MIGKGQKQKERANEKKKETEGKRDMIKKNNIRMMMAGIFCVGVLMGGLGTGIAFAEFSSFAYQPVEAPQEAFQTEKFIYLMPEETDKKIGINYFFGGALCQLKTREDILKGEAEICITYNAQACSVEFTDVVDDEDHVRLQFYLDCGGDFENFMRYKDSFLEGLRERKLRDYQVEYVKSVEVWVNPEDKERFYWN